MLGNVITKVNDVVPIQLSVKNLVSSSSSDTFSIWQGNNIEFNAINVVDSWNEKFDNFTNIFMVETKENTTSGSIVSKSENENNFAILYPSLDKLSGKARIRLDEINGSLEQLTLRWNPEA